MGQQHQSNFARYVRNGASSNSKNIKTKPKKLYIGIDPDLRKLSAAIVSEDKKPLAVFLRRNKEGRDDQAVVNAAYLSCRLVEDVLAYILSEAELFDPFCKLITIVESQSMVHTKQMRDKGKKINYERIRQLSQVAGCLMGAFSNCSQSMYLVQPIVWKGTIPKDIAHARYYKALDIKPDANQTVQNLYPRNMRYLCEYSEDHINPGDFVDINDSLGLALYGAKKEL